MSVTWPKAIALVVIAAILVSAAIVAGVCVGSDPSERPFSQQDTSTQRSAAGCTASEIAYAERLGRELERGAGALAAVGRLSERASRDAGIIYDSAWREDMIDALVTLRLVADALEASSPSSRFGDVWYSANDLAQSLRNVTYNMADGIDNLNAGSIGLAVSEMEYGAAVAATLTVQIDNACR